MIIAVNVSSKRVQNISEDNMGIKKVSAMWMRLLTEEQKRK